MKLSKSKSHPRGTLLSIELLAILPERVKITLLLAYLGPSTPTSRLGRQDFHSSALTPLTATAAKTAYSLFTFDHEFRVDKREV